VVAVRWRRDFCRCCNCFDVVVVVMERDGVCVCVCGDAVVDRRRVGVLCRVSGGVQRALIWYGVARQIAGELR
jgi:hypothetical protein